MTLEGLRSRLASRLELLTGGPRDLPARQQTLRDTIGWSHDLLDESERRLFRRLAVFAGGFTLETAEAVCTSEDDPDIVSSAGSGHAVLNGVASLVEKNLVRLERTVGEPRYGLLETIREFAWECAAVSGEAAEMQRRHADHYVALAEQAEPCLLGPEQSEWLDRLDVELGNVRARINTSKFRARGCGRWSERQRAASWERQDLAGA